MLVLSLLIPSYNDERILKILQELKDLSRDRLELIVQDAGSNQKLLQNIKSCLTERDSIFIEKDDGIFDGINKGIKNCNGKYILTIGSDDFVDANSLRCIINSIGDEDLLFCGVKLFDAKGKVRRIWRARKFSRWLYRLGAQYPHFGVIVKAEIYRNGLWFNNANKVNADYEFFSTLTKLKTLNVGYLNGVSVYMQLGGTSTRSPLNILRHQKLIFRFILRYEPDLILAPILKVIFKTEEVALAFMANEKVYF
jgi:glycosyltransferase involved in cell wall biosynthesis